LQRALEGSEVDGLLLPGTLSVGLVLARNCRNSAYAIHTLTFLLP